MKTVKYHVWIGFYSLHYSWKEVDLGLKNFNPPAFKRQIPLNKWLKDFAQGVI